MSKVYFILMFNISTLICGCSSLTPSLSPTAFEVNAYIIESVKCKPLIGASVLDVYSLGSFKSEKAARITAAVEVDNIINNGGKRYKGSIVDAKFEDGENIVACDQDGDVIVIHWGDENENHL